jgi:hypothetical protein
MDTTQRDLVMGCAVRICGHKAAPDIMGFTQATPGWV